MRGQSARQHSGWPRARCGPAQRCPPARCCKRAWWLKANRWRPVRENVRFQARVLGGVRFAERSSCTLAACRAEVVYMRMHRRGTQPAPARPPPCTIVKMLAVVPGSSLLLSTRCVFQLAAPSWLLLAGCSLLAAPSWLLPAGCS
eukprot:366331-Chlamydomonas_euryale.AAC.38